MGYRSLLMHMGLMSDRATEDEAADAKTEDALRDNARAFEKMKNVYKKTPIVNKILSDKIEKSSAPFYELEKTIRGGRI